MSIYLSAVSTPASWIKLGIQLAYTLIPLVRVSGHNRVPHLAAQAPTLHLVGFRIYHVFRTFVDGIV